MEDFVGAKFYCPHALADGNQCILIREKTLEFSTVLFTLSPYHSASISLCLIVYFIITAKAGYEKTDVFFWYRLTLVVRDKGLLFVCDQSVNR